jgi:hypothetical protein
LGAAIPAVLDPQGRIWTAGRDRGVHPDDETWYVERKK